MRPVGNITRMASREFTARSLSLWEMWEKIISLQTAGTPKNPLTANKWNYSLLCTYTALHPYKYKQCKHTGSVCMNTKAILITYILPSANLFILVSMSGQAAIILGPTWKLLHHRKSSFCLFFHSGLYYKMDQVAIKIFSELKNTHNSPKNHVKSVAKAEILK